MASHFRENALSERSESKGNPVPKIVPYSLPTFAERSSLCAYHPDRVEFDDT
jgi:hypothetical protein